MILAFVVLAMGTNACSSLKPSNASAFHHSQNVNMQLRNIALAHIELHSSESVASSQYDTRYSLEMRSDSILSPNDSALLTLLTPSALPTTFMCIAYRTSSEGTLTDSSLAVRVEAPCQIMLLNEAANDGDTIDFIATPLDPKLSQKIGRLAASFTVRPKRVTVMR